MTLPEFLADQTVKPWLLVTTLLFAYVAWQIAIATKNK